MATAIDLEEAQHVTAAELQEIGARIHAMRQERGWTLDTLALRSKLSKSYISRLEDGGRQPSIAALLSLSRALGISLAELMSDQSKPNSAKVVRGSDAPVVQGNGLVYQVHNASQMRPAMQPLRLTIPTGRVGDELYRHEGEEWLYVLSGELELILGDDTHNLRPGDSIYFDATIGHRLSAKGGRDVEAILVASLAQRALLSSYF